MLEDLGSEVHRIFFGCQSARKSPDSNAENTASAVLNRRKNTQSYHAWPGTSASSTVERSCRTEGWGLRCFQSTDTQSLAPRRNQREVLRLDMDSLSLMWEEGCFAIEPCYSRRISIFAAPSMTCWFLEGWSGPSSGAVSVACHRSWHSGASRQNFSGVP